MREAETKRRYRAAVAGDRVDLTAVFQGDWHTICLITPYDPNMASPEMIAHGIGPSGADGDSRIVTIGERVVTYTRRRNFAEFGPDQLLPAVMNREVLLQRPAKPCFSRKEATVPVQPGHGDKDAPP